MIPRDYETGKQKGYAFIEFEDVEDVPHAIQNYNNTEIYGSLFVSSLNSKGKVIKVKMTKVKPKKSAY